MSLKSQLLIIFLVLFSQNAVSGLFSKKDLSQNPNLVTKKEILQLAHQEGILDLALKTGQGLLEETLGLKEIPLKEGRLDFSKIDLKKVDYDHIIGLFANRKKMYDFSNWDLSGVDLSGRYMRDPSYIFYNVNFKGAILKRTRFMGSLKNIVMDETTKLEWTDLSSTNLSGADLRTDLSKTNLDMARYDKKTKFPSGFNPLDHDMIKITSCRTLF